MSITTGTLATGYKCGLERNMNHLDALSFSHANRATTQAALIEHPICPAGASSFLIQVPRGYKAHPRVKMQRSASCKESGMVQRLVNGGLGPSPNPSNNTRSRSSRGTRSLSRCAESIISLTGGSGAGLERFACVNTR